MGSLSPHFSLTEFACRCGCGLGTSPDDVDPRLIYALEALRLALGNRPITITSGLRCAGHNALIGGAANSQHTHGRAADIKVAGLDPQDVAKAAYNIAGFHDGGIKAYSTWTHVDVRQNGPWHEGF